MNEREELLAKFQKAMPLVNELSSLENKLAKYNKKKKRLATIIKVYGICVLLVFFIMTTTMKSDPTGIFFVSFHATILGIIIWLSVINKKKMKVTDDAITKICNSEEFSFIPFSYRNAVNIVGIYMVLVDMRADTFTAIPL